MQPRGQRCRGLLKWVDGVLLVTLISTDRVILSTVRRRTLFRGQTVFRTVLPHYGDEVFVELRQLFGDDVHRGIQMRELVGGL